MKTELAALRAAPGNATLSLSHTALTLNLAHTLTEQGKRLAKNLHIQIGLCRAEPSNAGKRVQQTRGTTSPPPPQSGHSALQK